MLNITNVKIRKIFTDDTLKALVSVTIGDSLAIHELKIISGPQRFFVAMPSRMDECGNFRDIIHPVDSETRQQLEDAVLAAYSEYLSSAEQEITN